MGKKTKTARSFFVCLLIFLIFTQVNPSQDTNSTSQPPQQTAGAGRR